jgi:O-acetyl-ADP-ribose deacetylase (regulator of RNase III)
VRLRVIVGDVTTLDVDAVVNAANPSLGPGSGVNGALRLAGGPGLREEMERIGRCATGDAVATAGHDLPARWVVHTVGPVWHGGGEGEADLLGSCYRRCVEVADGLGAGSLAFPAISTGVYGYPAEAAAGVAVRTLRGLRPASVRDCLLVAFDAAMSQCYEHVLDGDGPLPGRDGEQHGEV